MSHDKGGNARARVNSWYHLGNRWYQLLMFVCTVGTMLLHCLGMRENSHWQAYLMKRGPRGKTGYGPIALDISED
eukprot:4796876-Pyramimonas_sp.AAC.1